MSLKEILIVICGALVVVGVLLGGMFLLLGYDFPPMRTDTSEIKVECAEEDFSGLCGIRKFIQGDHVGVE